MRSSDLKRKFSPRAREICVVSKVLECRHQLHEFCVLCVFEPRRNWNRVLRVEAVRNRAVVDNGNALHASAHEAHVFDVISVHIGAMLAVQAVVHERARRVEVVYDAIGVRRQRGGKDANLEQLTNTAKKFVREGADLDVDIDALLVQLDNKRDVMRTIGRLYGSVHKGLVEIQHKQGSVML